jgi:hypothetical protein
MGLLAGLMILAGFGAWFSAKHRAAVPAAVFSAMTTLLVVTTPIGSWAPGAVAAVVDTMSSTGGQVASVQVQR